MRSSGILLAVLAVLTAACSGSDTDTTVTEPSTVTTADAATDREVVTSVPSSNSGAFVEVGAGVSVADSALAAGMSGSVELSGTPPDVGFQSWGSIYRVDATAQPSAPVAIRIPAPGPLPAETAVVVMVSDTPNGPWEPLETRQVLVDGTVEAITPHFSWFTAILAPFIDLVGEARKVFEDATAGFTAEAEQPTCEGEAEARQTVQITSANSDAVKWCLGVENGTTVLRVTNNRRYALQAAHPGLTVIDPGVDPSSIMQLTNDMDPRFVLLSPRRPVTMSVDSTTASLNIEFNGLADSLYQLQVGVETALTLLSKFGVSGDRYEAAATLMQSAKCAETMFDPTGGSIISNCFDAQSILEAFGPKAVVVAMLMTVAPLLDFFRSRFNAAADILQNRDEYWVTITPLPQPTTTAAPTPASQPATTVPPSPPKREPIVRTVCFGDLETRPNFLWVNCAATLALSDIVWDSWTDASATGTGNYIAGCGPVCGEPEVVPVPVRITLTNPQRFACGDAPADFVYYDLSFDPLDGRFGTQRWSLADVSC